MLDETRDLTPLFNCRSIAVIGASPRAHYALSILQGLQSIGFNGKIVGIHPKETSVLGFPCYRDLASVPFPIDMAVMVVHRDRIPGLLEECSQANVRAVTVISSGFAETGSEGRALEQELVRLADQHQIVLCGPNCLGFIAVAQRLSTYAHPALKLQPGNVAIVSHSGGLLNEVLEYGRYRGLNFSYLISAGNEAQIGLADYVNYLVDDPQTRVIGLIVEGIRQSLRFKAALDKAMRAKKPVVLIKIGRSELAQKAALTHTGATVGSSEVFSALCRQFGVSQVKDVSELCETLLLFSRSHHLFAKTKPNGVVALEISGGGKGLICDLADTYGVPLPEIEDALTMELVKVMPEGTEAVNPLDLVLPWNAPGSLELHRSCLDILGKSEAVDIIVSRVTVPMSGSSEAALAHRSEMVEAQGRFPDKLFLMLGRTSAMMPEDWRAILSEPTVPYLQEYRRGLAAIGSLVQYRRILSRSFPTRPAGPSFLTTGLNLAGPRALDEVESKAVLAAIDVPVNKTVFVEDEGSAVAAANELGYPVALKGISPAAIHKSDYGLVELNIADSHAVAAAAKKILDSMRRLPDTGPGRIGISVQSMIPSGIETIVGGYRDPGFGPIVVCGLGGVWTEILQDRSMRLAPVTIADAAEMTAETHIARLAEGYRGAPPFNLERLHKVIVRMGQLFVEHPEISEFDLNPIFCAHENVTVADARIILSNSD